MTDISGLRYMDYHSLLLLSPEHQSTPEASHESLRAALGTKKALSVVVD
jgi:hypothetical protein